MAFCHTGASTRQCPAAWPPAKRNCPLVRSSPAALLNRGHLSADQASTQHPLSTHLRGPGCRWIRATSTTPQHSQPPGPAALKRARPICTKGVPTCVQLAEIEQPIKSGAVFPKIEALVVRVGLAAGLVVPILGIVVRPCLAQIRHILGGVVGLQLLLRCAAGALQQQRGRARWPADAHLIRQAAGCWVHGRRHNTCPSGSHPGSPLMQHSRGTATGTRGCSTAGMRWGCLCVCRRAAAAGAQCCRVLPLPRHRVKGPTTLQLLLCYAVGALQQHEHIVRVCAPSGSCRQHLSGCRQGCCRT